MSRMTADISRRYLCFRMSIRKALERTSTATAPVLVNFNRNGVSPGALTISLCSCLGFDLRRSLVPLGQITSAMPGFLPSQ